MSFSTAELFQSSANGSMTHNGKSKIRTGNSMKISKNKKNNNYNHYNNYNNNRIFHEKQDSAHFIHHVPHNSTSEHYRFFEDITGNGNIFQHEHITGNANNNNFAHIHNNSLASISNQNNPNLYHNRNDTISKYALDDTLEVIDGDIPSQKDIMKDFFEERVNQHLQQKSSLFDALDKINKNEDVSHHNNNNNNDDHKVNVNIMSDTAFSGTVREIISSPLDESDIINFNDLPLQDRYNDIDIPDYTDDENEDNHIDRMQLIAAKNSLKSSFPDTQPITHSLKKKSYRRRRHNTKKSPIPQIGDMTPSSVVIRSDDSDNDTYVSSNDSEPHPISHRGSQRLKTPTTNSASTTQNNTPLPPSQIPSQKRSNTIGNMTKMIKKSNTYNKNKHRHSRSEVPSIKKNDLFNIYKRKPFAGDSAKKYFSNLTQAAKSSQYEAEKKARRDMEKKYKPQLQKTQLELDEARRKSLKQQEEMNNMKKELLLLKKTHTPITMKSSKSSTNEKEISKKLREKNLQIQELQSKLKFETLKNNSIISPISPIIPVPVATLHNKYTINRSKTKVKTPISGVNEGLHRLKKRVSIKKSNKMQDLKKRKSLPDSLSKKHKRPLWTNRCKNNVTNNSNMKRLTKSKTFDSDDGTEESKLNDDKYKKFGIKNRVIKKRESLLFPPRPKNLKNRFFDRNKIKRNSWNAGDDKGDKVDYDKLKDILVAAQQNHKISALSEKHNANDVMISKYKDIKSKYDHLLAENEILRKENFEKKDELKKYGKAPIPNVNNNRNINIIEEMKSSINLPPPTFKIERQKKMKKKKKKDIIKKKRLLQIPRTKMKSIDWIPIENNIIKDTRWKYIGNQSDDIIIPNEFEQLFCMKKVEKEEKEFSGCNREEIVGIKLKKMKLTPQDIRFALLNVSELKLSEKILYNLLEIVPNLNEQKDVQNKMNSIQENAFSESTYLSFVEQFFYELSDINHLKLRVELILFKYRFQNIINERYNELYILLQSLKSIQRSSNFERILSIILTFGNFMNADSSGCGINGFKLESLLNFAPVKSNGDGDGDGSHTFLSYICKYCIENNKKKYLNIISELDLCIRASSIKSYECHQKILLITEELSKFGRSLRKFRKKAIANNNADGPTYKAIENDLFETTMRDFARKAHLICKSLLDLRHEIITIAQILSTQYNYDLNVDKIEDLLGIFAKFVGDLKYAKNVYVNYCRREKSNVINKFILDKKKEKLNKFLIKKNKMVKNEEKPIYVYDQDTIELKEREKDENIQKISKLIYEHAILMDQQHINYYENNEIMSYQRIKYLKGLAKSNELPNQLSNNPEAIQKERRRRRSLTNTDIQIGNKMAMTLAEDEEMK